MSTRSVIARTGKNEGEFAGVYVHWDGAPTTRGPILWQIIHQEFKGDLKAALSSLLDTHPAGWSSLSRDGVRNCYCHPQRSKVATHKGRKPEPASEFTHEHVVKGDTDIEWLYAFDEERNRLFVRDVRHGDEFVVELGEPEPDWAVIECGEHFERCSHMAWFHKLTPKTSNLSTATWLGTQPLEFRDAIAFIIDGTRWASTGSGFSSAYASMRGGESYPRNTWVASVKAKNGRRIDAAVAQLKDGKYLPIPGVTWIYPPTKRNPQETLVTE